jgi:hypothetical protein
MAFFAGELLQQVRAASAATAAVGGARGKVRGVGTAATVGVDVRLNWPKIAKTSIRDYGCDSLQNYVLLSG